MPCPKSLPHPLISHPQSLVLFRALLFPYWQAYCRISTINTSASVAVACSYHQSIKILHLILDLFQLFNQVWMTSCKRFKQWLYGPFDSIKCWQLMFLQTTDMCTFAHVIGCIPHWHFISHTHHMFMTWTSHLVVERIVADLQCETVFQPLSVQNHWTLLM